MTRFAERVRLTAAVFVTGFGVLLGLAGGSRPAPLAAQDKGNAPAAKG